MALVPGVVNPRPRHDSTQLDSTQLDSGTNGCAWPGKRQSQREVNAMTAEARRGQTLSLLLLLLLLLQRLLISLLPFPP